MSRPTRWTALHLAAGILAAGAGIAVAHLVASLLDPQSSPVLAVGSTVVDATPTPVKEWAVEQFGTADKPILLGSVLVVTLLAAGLAGVLARRRLRLGVAVVLVLVALAAAAAMRRPQAAPEDVLPSLAAAVLGPLALGWLVRALGNLEGTPASPDAESGSSRRGFLIGSGALLLGGAAAAGAGQWIYRARARLSDIVLPRAARALPALATGLEETVPGITPFRTPTDRFYRVDTKLAVPIVDEGGWRLTVDGRVEREVSLTYDELCAMPLAEHDITLTCVSNEVGGRYVGAARWLGVRLTDVLDLAGVDPSTDQLLSTDVDGFRIGTPMAALRDGRDAIIALGMNGSVLPREHGFPARLVVPGLYGYVSATKWVTRLTATTYADDRSYWTKRGWAEDGPIKVSSRIDTPRGLSTLDAGRVAIGGVAWAQHEGVAGVEVSIDGGPWREATLGPDAGIDYWRQWYLPWDATPGSHRLASRATGRAGTVQTAVRAGSFPDGSSGIQEVVVTVA